MNKALFKKLLPFFVLSAGVAYGVWPLDAIPDIPIVGWLDDVGVMGTAFIIALMIWTKKSRGREDST